METNNTKPWQERLNRMTQQDAAFELERLGLTVGESWEYVGGARGDRLWWYVCSLGENTLSMKVYFDALQRKAGKKTKKRRAT